MPGLYLTGLDGGAVPERHLTDLGSSAVPLQYTVDGAVAIRRGATAVPCDPVGRAELAARPASMAMLCRCGA